MLFEWDCLARWKDGKPVEVMPRPKGNLPRNSTDASSTVNQLDGSMLQRIRAAGKGIRDASTQCSANGHPCVDFSELVEERCVQIP